MRDEETEGRDYQRGREKSNEEMETETWNRDRDEWREREKEWRKNG